LGNDCKCTTWFAKIFDNIIIWQTLSSPLITFHMPKCTTPADECGWPGLPLGLQTQALQTP
jgi:hypothetical protein